MSVSFMALESAIERQQAREEQKLLNSLADAWTAGDRAEYMRLWRLRNAKRGVASGFVHLTGFSRPVC